MPKLVIYIDIYIAGLINDSRGINKKDTKRVVKKFNMKGDNMAKKSL